MQISATIVKIVGILIQYGLLALLLLFVYKILRYMRDDSQSMIDDAYAKVEILSGEALLEVVETGDDRLQGKKFTVSNKVTIGKSKDNDIIIKDDIFVSHCHARIFVEGNQYVLEDLGSSTGTVLNGQKLEHNAKVFIQSGSTISIGMTTFEFAR